MQTPGSAGFGVVRAGRAAGKARRGRHRCSLDWDWGEGTACTAKASPRALRPAEGVGCLERSPRPGRRAGLCAGQSRRPGQAGSEPHLPAQVLLL